MAENLTIARPYALAVFELAKEQEAQGGKAGFDQWTNTLEALSLVVSDENIADMIEGASTAEAASDLMIKLLGDLLDELGQNFVRVLGENQRFLVVPEIYQEFKRLRDDYLKIKNVEIISARPLSAEDEKALAAKLEAKYQAKISITHSIDPSIMGGIIIKIGDEVIDGSVKTSLSSLSSTLK